MSFTSKLDWDTDIGSVGGQNNVMLVDSPYSNLPSANASQGALTYGNLIREYAPPKISISSIDNGYYVHSRMDMSRKNPAVEDLTRFPNEATVVPTMTPKEGYKEAAGGRKPLKRAKQGQPNQDKVANPKQYVGPSRKGQKTAVNPARGNVVDENTNPPAATETYIDGIPGLVGSNIHHEAFEEKTSLNIIAVILIVLCAIIVGGIIFRLVGRFWKPAGMLGDALQF